MSSTLHQYQQTRKTMNPTDLMIQNAIGGFMTALIGQLSTPANMQYFTDAIFQPLSSDHCKNPADVAIVALKCYKNGQLSKDQALRICSIALEESGKTIDVESVAILEKLFR